MRLVGFQSVGCIRQLMLRLPVIWHGTYAESLDSIARPSDRLPGSGNVMKWSGGCGCFLILGRLGLLRPSVLGKHQRGESKRCS